MMFWYDHGLSGWGYAWMSIWMVVFWGLLIAGFVMLVKFASQPHDSRPSTPESITAEQLLAARFARGEIDRDEYVSRLETLRGHGTNTTHQATNS
ncbi:SHOCT domain-containing protein [Nocardia sp. NPDC051463]|uniref:SHOCT domain-containing protein n=1 Tax=Nocardia sp. NPDC051463 TaxID=3154845 RepID=UPI003421850F